LTIEPGYPRAVSNLAGALAGLGRSAEAITTYRRALQLDPNYAWAHYGLANTLRDANQLPEAAAEYRVFIAARSVNTDAVNSLRRVQIRQGQIKQVWSEWQQTLKTNPQQYSVWSGAAELALYLNDQPSYLRIRSELLNRFGDNISLAGELARSCLLRAGSSGEIHKAAAIIAQKEELPASASVHNRALAKFDNGLAQYRLEQFEAAIATLSSNTDQSFETCNRLVIAMALMRKEEPTEARQVFADAIAGFDWTPDHADRRDVWICHILRREAEPLIFPALLRSNPVEISDGPPPIK
jgi:tetratricopeptide (TPR) repeat protein